LKEWKLKSLQTGQQQFLHSLETFLMYNS